MTPQKQDTFYRIEAWNPEQKRWVCYMPYDNLPDAKQAFGNLCRGNPHKRWHIQKIECLEEHIPTAIT